MPSRPGQSSGTISECASPEPDEQDRTETVARRSSGLKISPRRICLRSCFSVARFADPPRRDHQSRPLAGETSLYEVMAVGPNCPVLSLINPQRRRGRSADVPGGPFACQELGMRPYQRFELNADFSPLSPLLEAMMSKKHPGFAGAMKQVEAKEGVSKSSAAKIIGAGKANASAAAREKNPRLNKTGGKKGGY